MAFQLEDVVAMRKICLCFVVNRWNSSFE